MIILFDFDRIIFDTDQFIKEYMPSSKAFPTSFKGDELKRFIFSDVWKFFDDKLDARRFLITYGNTALQKIKIDSTDTAKLFEDVIFTGDEMKGAVLARNIIEGWGVGEQIVFVDDNAEQLVSVTELCPNVVTVCMLRDEVARERNGHAIADYRVENMDELYKILKTSI